MTRPRKRTTRRFDLPKKHPYYNFGYIYDRNGIAYARLGSNKMISTKMQFNNSNKDILLERLVEIIDKEHDFNTGLTLQDLYDKYFQLNELTDTYKNKHRQAIKNFTPENIELDEIKIKEQIAYNLKNSKLSNGSKNRSLQILKKIFDFSVEYEMLDKNPITKSMIPALQKTDLKIFTKDEIEMLLEYVKPRTLNMYYLIKFISKTGARIQEVLNIKFEHITKDRIKIIGKADNKGKKRIRFIPIKPFDLDVMIQEIKEHRNNQNPVFKYTNQNKCRETFVKYCKQLNIYERGKTFHSIRKYAENTMLKTFEHKPYHTKYISMILGHDETTQKKYYTKEKEFEDLEKWLE